MELDNPFDVIVHFLLIEGMTYPSYCNGFPMLSVWVQISIVNQILKLKYMIILIKKNQR